MFFIKEFQHSIYLSPKHLGPNVQKHVQDFLVESVEGKPTPNGYLICILDIDTISEGKILYGGNTFFKIKYRALVLNLLGGEVVDGMVESIQKLGVFAKIGPLTAFIHNSNIPASTYDAICDGCALKMRIVACKIDPNKVYAIATLNDDYLGPFNL